MAPLQSCLVGQTKPFGEKFSKITQKKKPKPLKKTEIAVLAIFGLLPRIPIFSYWLVWMEPKLLFSQSSTQHKSYRAHTIGQFCHQD